MEGHRIHIISDTSLTVLPPPPPPPPPLHQAAHRQARKQWAELQLAALALSRQMSRKKKWWMLGLDREVKPGQHDIGQAMLAKSGIRQQHANLNAEVVDCGVFDLAIDMPAFFHRLRHPPPTQIVLDENNASDVAQLAALARDGVDGFPRDEWTMPVQVPHSIHDHTTYIRTIYAPRRTGNHNNIASGNVHTNIILKKNHTKITHIPRTPQLHKLTHSYMYIYMNISPSPSIPSRCV